MDAVTVIQRIIANNPTGIYASLVAEGRMLPGATPSVAEIVSVLQTELATRPDNAAFLLRVLNVPVNSQGLYYQELTNLSQTTGQTPVVWLAGQMNADDLNQKSIATQHEYGRRSLFGLVVLALAIFGLVKLLQLIFKQD